MHPFLSVKNSFYWANHANITLPSVTCEIFFPLWCQACKELSKLVLVLICFFGFILQKKTPIINATFVFIVFLWPWCILPLEYRWQQQIKDRVTLLRDKKQPQNFKMHIIWFPGLWVGESFVFLSDLSPQLCFYFNSLSVSPSKDQLKSVRSKLDLMPLLDYATLSVLVTLEGTCRFLSVPAMLVREKLQVSIPDFKWTHMNMNRFFCWKARVSWLFNLLHTKFRETDLRLKNNEFSSARTLLVLVLLQIIRSLHLITNLSSPSPKCQCSSVIRYNVARIACVGISPPACKHTSSASETSQRGKKNSTHLKVDFEVSWSCFHGDQMLWSWQWVLSLCLSFQEKTHL